MRPVAWLAALVATSAAAVAPTMTNLNPATKPSQRTGPAVAIVPGGTGSTEQMCLLGGNALIGSTSNETWMYSVSSNNWTQLTVTGAPPSRAWANMTWDVAQARIVLHGGSAALSGPLLSDVQLFNPSTGSWTAAVQNTPAPSARFLAKLFYIPHQQRHLLMFGGTATSATAVATTVTNEVWSLVVSAAAGTATWTQVTPGGTAPPARASTCAGYDPVRHRVIVFGGEIIGDTLADTVEYDVDTNAWIAVTPTGSVPTKRGTATCTFDERTGKLLLYGGASSPSGSPMGGAYSYDPVAQVWTLLNPATTPGNLTFAGAAFSQGLGGMLFFGGRQSALSVSQATWLMKVNAAPLLALTTPITVNEGAVGTLTAAASDPDMDALALGWTQVAGPAVMLAPSSAVPAPTFTAPRVTSDTTLQFFASVTDGVDARDGGVTVTVRDTINEPPIVDAGPSLVVNEGAQVALSGSATDPNGEALTFLWTQTAGPPVSLSSTTSPAASFTSPRVTTASQVVLRLDATDTRAGSGSGTVTITVQDSINVPPVANAGLDQAVATGAAVVLDGSGSSDPNGEALSFAWTQVGGPAVALTAATSAQPGFTAPSTAAALSFSLTVTDPRMGSSSDVVQVAVGAADGGAMDAGSAFDGGVVDGGVTDGGVTDGGAADGGAVADGGAGSDAGAVVADAGASTDGGEPRPVRQLGVGCGCSSGPDASLLFVLALLLRGRRVA